MKMKEIQEKQGDQLDAELLEKQKHLFDLRSQAVTEKLEDPSQLGKTKKDIARIKTAMRQRQIEQEGNGPAGRPAEGRGAGRTVQRQVAGVRPPQAGERVQAEGAGPQDRRRQDRVAEGEGPEGNVQDPPPRQGRELAVRTA
jgi:large subunit ribosomal protein L29